jgi:hypothetical protein
MTKLNLSLFAGWVALGISVVPAHAQQARSFVSGLGNDGNAPNCTRTAPCRTFQVAHDNTLANGEITVIDPGSYGSVTINRNVSIINDGVGEAGALVSGGANGVTINAPAGAAVTLRGLTIKGIGFGGGNGIVFNTGTFLSIENCVIRNLSGSGTIGHGVIFAPTTAGTPSVLAVSNTMVTDNVGHGIAVVPLVSFAFPSLGTQAMFNRVQSYHNGGWGIIGDITSGGPLFMAVESTVAAYNHDGGFGLNSPSGLGPSFMNVTRSVALGNSIAFEAGVSGVLNVGQSNIIGNGVTWTGQVQSFQDNYASENRDGDPAAPLGVVLKK